MATPNYGILQSLKDMQSPVKNNPILQELIDFQGARRDATQAQEQSAIRAAQQQLLGTQAKQAQSELDYLPKQRELDELKARASIDATRASTAATRHGMTTETLRQKSLQQDQIMKGHKFAYDTIGAIQTLPPAARQAALSAVIPEAEAAYGFKWPKNVPKDVAHPDTQAYLQNMHITSGQALESAKLKKAQAEVGVAQNPIAAELPKEQAKQLIKMQDETGAQSEGAATTLNNINTFEANYKKIAGGTGIHAPALAKFSPAAQQADQAASDMTRSLMSSIKGAASDKDVELLAKSMPRISNTVGANEKILKRLRAASERIQQKPLFEQTMVENGIYDPSKIRATWTKFVKENPLYDAKTGAVLDKNVNAWDKYIPGNVAQKTLQNPENDLSGMSDEQLMKIAGG